SHGPAGGSRTRHPLRTVGAAGPGSRSGPLRHLPAGELARPPLRRRCALARHHGARGVLGARIQVRARDRRRRRRPGPRRRHGAAHRPIQAASFRQGAPRVKVLVVGGVLSALVAAIEIQSAGHEVTVLEARDRVGGRVFTLREGFADGQFADLGAEIIYHGQDRIVDLCAKHGVELSDEFSLGTDVPELIFGGERLDRAAAAEISTELRTAIKRTKPSPYESVAQWLRRARVSEPAELLLTALAQSTPAA